MALSVPHLLVICALVITLLSLIPPARDYPLLAVSVILIAIALLAT